MEITITGHAIERMEKYNIRKEDLLETVRNPTITLGSHSNRHIFQRSINGYVIRAICEKVKNTIVIITVYKARKDRYEIQI